MKPLELSSIVLTCRVACRGNAHDSVAIGIVQDITSLNSMNGSGTQDQLILRENASIFTSRSIRKSFDGIPHVFTEWMASADATQRT